MPNATDTVSLTAEEISILLEAMDAWVHRRSTGELIGELFVSVMENGDPKAKLDIEERRRTIKLEQQLDAETAVLLKAKLIRIRQGV